MTRLAPKDQKLPSWAEVERAKRRQGTWVCQDCITRMTVNQKTCTNCGQPQQVKPKPPPVWTCKNCDYKMSGVRDKCRNCGHSKIGTAPKAAPKSAEIPRLHIRIELAGSCELVLEGDQANEMRAVLTGRAVNSDDVIEALDPYSSGITLNQEIRVIEDPDKPMGGNYHSWSVSEERGEFAYRPPGSAVFSPFRYTVESGKPKSVDWRQVQ